jgi:hypothetical protein
MLTAWQTAAPRSRICTACVLVANFTLRLLIYNLVANAALYLFYGLTPFFPALQTLNRAVLWRIFWF